MDLKDKVFGQFYPDSPDEFSEPADLKNLPVSCVKCGSRHVIYYISKPAVHFPIGGYCYKCLLQSCRLSRRIPVPMEQTLQSRLEVDLGIAHARKYYLGVKGLPGLSL